MNIDECIKKIDKYLTKSNMQPLIVDVQTAADLSAVVTHYNVGSNLFIAAEEFCNNDEYPRIEALIDVLSHQEKPIFITGLSSFLKLKGEQFVRETLKNILSMSSQTHVVLLTFRCRKYLEFSDPRLGNRLCIVNGESDVKQTFIFAANNMPLPDNANVITGIQGISQVVENDTAGTVYIVTSKAKANFPSSLFPIVDLNKAYNALCMIDNATEAISEEIGTDEQWRYALSLFEDNASWADVIDTELGDHKNLELALNNYTFLSPLKKWLFFIALKLFGCKNNWNLKAATLACNDYPSFLKCVYRAILSVQITDKNFARYYSQRKVLLNQIGNPINEVMDYCKIVLSKGKNAIYYLTDNTQKEKDIIFFLLEKYRDEFTKEQIVSILKEVYPDLAAYLFDYKFSQELLNSYFSQYKYQKVINKLLPNFMDVVSEQAEKRDYNLLLEPRSAIVESLKKDNTQLYFMDAMGVEYLGFIITLCKEMGLTAKVSVCKSELPSLTCENKEFLSYFEDSDFPVVSIKDLDEIKHHGKGDYDYQQTKLPVYLAKELEIIRDTLQRIKGKLIEGDVKKVVMISDHGASRLAVLYDNENLWEMSEQGKHSGRCCPKSDVDIQPAFATDTGNYWALANYDRFKGGRKANVEVHGGATLEEVTVPVIELMYMNSNAEIFIMAADDNSANLEKTATVTVSFRKKAKIKLFSTSELENVSVEVNGNKYEAVYDGNNYYSVELPDIKKPNTYSLDVYSNDCIISSELTLIVKNEGMGNSGKGIL